MVVGSSCWNVSNRRKSDFIKTRLFNVCVGRPKWNRRQSRAAVDNNNNIISSNTGRLLSYCRTPRGVRRYTFISCSRRWSHWRSSRPARPHYVVVSLRCLRRPKPRSGDPLFTPPRAYSCRHSTRRRHIVPTPFVERISAITPRSRRVKSNPDHFSTLLLSRHSFSHWFSLPCVVWFTSCSELYYFDRRRVLNISSCVRRPRDIIIRRSVFVRAQNIYLLFSE